MSSNRHHDENNEEAGVGDNQEEEDWKSDDSVEESAASESEFEGSDSEDEEEVNFRRGGRSLLWLCQEGQIQLARKRFEWLVLQGEGQQEERVIFQQQLHKEVFQVGHDKNYALHEILMGGTSDRNGYQLTLLLLDYASASRDKQSTTVTKMLAARPPSHQRTALHWAAWGNATLDILQELVRLYPEGLVLRDKRTQNQRTPLEILKHYYYNDNSNNETVADTSRLDYLQRCTARWTQHRLRLAVHMSVTRYFAPSIAAGAGDIATKAPPAAPAPAILPRRTPFDKNDRKQTNIKPKAWFVLSVLGCLVQREMQPLAVHILEYMGREARVKGAKTTTRKRRKPSQPTTAVATNSSTTATTMTGTGRKKSGSSKQRRKG